MCECEAFAPPSPPGDDKRHYVSANYILPSKMISLQEGGGGDLQANCTGRDPSDLHDLRWAAYQVAFPLLVGVGVVANLLNLVVLSRPAMKGVAYRYLNHLALSDLVYLLLNVPFCLGDFARVSGGRAVPLASAFYYAHVGVPLANLALTVSDHAVVWLSYDRFLAVCAPGRFSAARRLGVVRARLWASLVVSALVYVPSPLRQEYECPRASWGACCVGVGAHAREAWFVGYELLREVYSRLLPAALVAAFNAAIVVTLRRRRRRRRSPSEERERRLFFLLTAVTAFFCVSAFPSALYKLLVAVPRDLAFFPYLRASADVLEVSGHVFNFVLYFLFSPDYRRALASMLLLQRHDGLDGLAMASGMA